MKRVKSEWLALPPGATVRSQPKLLLRAMSGSGSGSTQQQVSVLDVCDRSITTREHGAIPSYGSHGDHMDVQGLFRTGPASTRCGTLES